MKYGKGGDRDLTDVHGNYCGYNAHGQSQSPFDPGSGEHLAPEDGLDNACRYHDQAYENVGKIKRFDQILNRLDGDFNLLVTGFDYALQKPLNSSNLLEGIGVTFVAQTFIIFEVSVLIPLDFILGLTELIGIHF